MNEGLRLRFSELIDLIYTHTEPTVRQVLANRVDVLFKETLREIESTYDKGQQRGYLLGSDRGYELGFTNGERVGRKSSGYTEGYKDGKESGYMEGYALGYYDGDDEGYSIGYDHGVVKGKTLR